MKRGLLLLGCVAACSQSTTTATTGGPGQPSLTSGTSGSGGTSGSETSSASGSGQTGTAGTGSSGASCSTNPELAGNELAACTSDGDCGCPLICTTDAALQAQLCERPCQTLSDCPSLYSTCNGQTCAPVPCTTFDAVCAFGDGGGSCLPFGATSNVGFNWQTTGLCSQGGNIAKNQPCPTGQFRPVTAADLCTAGTLCAPEGGSVACGELCDPTLPGACANAGGSCVVFDQSQPRLGVCDLVDAGFGDGGLACNMWSGGCVFYTDCCSLNCRMGVCCSTDGGDCHSDVDCCGNHCGDNDTCI